jgi:hypothetical protein
MALPTESRQIDDVLSHTTDLYLEDLDDQVYSSNPLYIRLDNAGRIVEGGAQMNWGIIYDKVPGGSYGRGETFNTSIVNTKTQFRAGWARYYANCTIDGLEEVANSGANAIVDAVETLMEQAKMRIADEMGTDLIQSGGTDSDKLLGLLNYVNDGTIGGISSYAGITYGTDTLGAAIKAKVNTTGGAFSLSGLNVEYGRATINPAKVDLILTTQTIWDKIWDRSQPSQRFSAGSEHNDLTKLGYSVVKFNGADVVPDTHVPSGYIYGLNTNFLELVILRGRNMVFEGWFRPANLDQRIGQVLWSGQLRGRAPRLNFVMTGIT